MSWGDADLGGDAGHVQDQLTSNVLRHSDPLSTHPFEWFAKCRLEPAGVYANPFAFAAVKDDGSVVTWGLATAGGDSSSVRQQHNPLLRVSTVRPETKDVDESKKLHLVCFALAGSAEKLHRWDKLA